MRLPCHKAYQILVSSPLSTEVAWRIQNIDFRIWLGFCLPLSRSRVVKIATPFCPLHANSFRLLLTSTELLFIPISHSHLWCFGFYFEAVGVPLVPLFASNFQLFLSAFSDECWLFFFSGLAALYLLRLSLFLFCSAIFSRFSLFFPRWFCLSLIQANV